MRFDKMINTPPVGVGIQKTFSKHNYNADNRYHLVIDDVTVAGVDIFHTKFNNTSGKHAMLYCVEVYEPYRKLGYGKILLNEAERVCRELGISIIGLNVDKENTYAIKLYNSVGFEIISQLEGYRWEHGMRKFLTEGIREEYLKKFDMKVKEKLLYTPGMMLNKGDRIQTYDGCIGIVNESTPLNMTYTKVVVHMNNEDSVIDKEKIHYLLYL